MMRSSWRLGVSRQVYCVFPGRLTCRPRFSRGGNGGASVGSAMSAMRIFRATPRWATALVPYDRTPLETHLEGNLWKPAAMLTAAPEAGLSAQLHCKIAESLIEPCLRNGKSASRFTLPADTVSRISCEHSVRRSASGLTGNWRSWLTAMSVINGTSDSGLARRALTGQETRFLL